MKNLKIGMDIDGVIVDLVTAILPLLSKACGRSVCHRDIYCFDIGKALHIEKQMQDIWAEVYSSNMLRSAPPIKGAIVGLNELRGHINWLVTQRPKSAKKDTERWLRDKKIKYDNLEFVSGVAKHSVANDFDVFLEDNLEQACAIAEAGINSLLLDQPWNQSSALPQKCRRVQDWDAIVTHIKTLERMS